MTVAAFFTAWRRNYGSPLILLPPLVESSPPEGCFRCSTDRLPGN